MTYVWEVHAVLGLCWFIVGTIVGSFLNVCIYRIPLEKSVIWPDSRCPKCLGRIGALQNVPILSWLVLGASCKTCKLPISARYPFVEALVGVLFAAVYLVDAQYAFESRHLPSATVYLAVLYHSVFVALLVAISFIDFDWTIVPPSLTNFGIFWGLLLGTIDPRIRPLPAAGTTYLDGLAIGVIGAVVGAGIVLTVRILGAIVFRREAMGAGDIHILAVVGAVMGWRAAVLSFFLSAFFGLIPALVKFIPYLIKRVTGREWNPSDREIPLGPFLSMAAVTLLLAWPWAWRYVLDPYFGKLAWLVRDLLGSPN
jgi:leader peptidase (prepilin peptidase) / N-methyltransferase